MEIKDKKLIKQIKKSLGVAEGGNRDDIPYICGSIVNGGFSRKLKMLRHDLYSLLSVCENNEFVQSFTQTKKIKRGITALVNSSQN